MGRYRKLTEDVMHERRGIADSRVNTDKYSRLLFQ